jgi:hypothetical protein
MKKLIAAAALSLFAFATQAAELGEPSADYLRDNGFSNARYVINGFQGAAIKEVRKPATGCRTADRTAACHGGRR